MDDRQRTLRDLELRLDELERRTAADVHVLRTAIAAFRAQEPETAPEPAPAVTADPWAWAQTVDAPEPEPAPNPEPAAPTPPPAAPRTPTWLERTDWAALVSGPRGLALAGGVVSLLGIVFLFVLAADNGWLTHGMRVAIGAAVSIALFAAAVELMRRYGRLYSATAAVAAAIGGSYATLYAATAMYHFLPAWGALAVVALVAAVATFLAARWDSEVVAGLGLVSATFSPLAVQHEVTFVGLLFAAIVFSTTAALLATRGWRILAAACWASTAALTLVYLVHADAGAARDLVVAGLFAGLHTTAASLDQLSRRRERVAPLSYSMLFGTVLLGLVAVHEAWDFEGWRPGITFLVAGAAFGALAAAWFRRPQGRTFAALCWAVALVFAGTGAAAILSGPALAIAWALEAAALVVLARLAREIRLQIAAAVYVLLAAGHGLILDTPPWHLYGYVSHPAGGVAGVAALALALALAAFVLRTGSAARDDAPTRLERLLATHERTAGDVAAVASLVVGSYAVLAAILQVAQWLSGTRSSFEWGHAAATGFLAATAVALLVLGSRRVGPPRLWLVGLAWLGVTLLELTWADSHLLGPAQLELAQSLVGGILLAGGYVAARVGLNEARYAVYGLVPVSAVLAAHVAATSVDGDSRGYLFALLAAVYGALTAASFVGPRDRNLIALLTAPATLFAAAAAVTLVESWWLAPALAALAASLLLLARAVREPRFQLYGLGLGAGVAGVAAWFAPPTHLLRAVEHPAAGIGAVATIVVLLALAAATVAGDADGDALDRRYAELAPALARRLWWGAAGAALYGVSLLVLELFHRLGGGSLHTGFQRGETAVSGLWALVGLGLLCLGLFRRRRPVRIGGLVLLAVALVKLFAFDLSNLSSLSRAVSFLVVGAALLGGGFVYQRLNAELGGGANTA